MAAKAKFIPQGDRYLVSVIDQERMLEGVLLPDSAKEDIQIAIVVSVGNGMKFTIGDRVMVGPWAGKNISIEGVPFRVVREEEIDGKIIYE